MADNTQRPIVIKRVKKHAAGHHGGAWKIAYADFVTAMMAFFLLMWLLNATTEKQRKGIADYFRKYRESYYGMLETIRPPRPWDEGVRLVDAWRRRAYPAGAPAVWPFRPPSVYADICGSDCRAWSGRDRCRPVHNDDERPQAPVEGICGADTNRV